MLVCLVCTASGCMLMYRGTTESFTVMTTPDGAAVKLSDGQTCVSPCTKEVKRRKDIGVKIRKDGCKDEDLIVHSRVEGKTAFKFGLSYAGLVYLGLPLVFVLGYDASGVREDIAALLFATGFVALVAGLPADAATGSMKSISPNPLTVTLDCS